MHQDKDRCGKWLLGAHGDAILKLAGITGFTSWKHIPSEVVAPRRLLDGLIEIRYPNDIAPTLVLVEIESYSNTDAGGQAMIVLEALESKSFEEVREQFKQRLSLELRRDDILNELKSRFGIVSEEITQTIQKISEPLHLQQLYRIAVSCSSLVSFIEQLDNN